MGNCLDLQGLPRLVVVNDRLINIVSVLQIVYTYLPWGRVKKNTAAGDSKQEQEGKRQRARKGGKEVE